MPEAGASAILGPQAGAWEPDSLRFRLRDTTVFRESEDGREYGGGSGSDARMKRSQPGRTSYLSPWCRTTSLAPKLQLPLEGRAQVLTFDISASAGAICGSWMLDARHSMLVLPGLLLLRHPWVRFAIRGTSSLLLLPSLPRRSACSAGTVLMLSASREEIDGVND